MRTIIGFAALLPLLVTATPVIETQTIHRGIAPLLSSTTAVEISDSYIVVFKDHVTHGAAVEHHSWVQDLHLGSEAARDDLRKRSQIPILGDIYEGFKHTYNIAGNFLGYSGHFDEDVLEAIRRHPDVDYVEKDSVVHTMRSIGRAPSVASASNGSAELENGAPWGLARISHRKGLGFGTFNKYLYYSEGGEGVDVYIIDTGTNIKHLDFEGRASWGKTIPNGDADEDNNGHGTHCSGTVAGAKYGVAKKAHVRAVKVLRSNGSGTMSDVVKGVEWAAEAHLSELKRAKDGKRKGFKGSTANMSLGGGKSVTLDRSVNAAVDAGLHFAVAAGNDNADSCNYSPAAAEGAVTVGASALDDERAYFSNFGRCNDIFAPGLNIQSTWIGSNTAINTISGTSMASPHIAGLLAYMLSLQPAKDSAYAVADISPKKLKAELLLVATKGIITNAGVGTANLLAWNGAGSGNYSDIVAQGGYTHVAEAEVEGAETGGERLAETLREAADDVRAVKAVLAAELRELLDAVVAK